MTEEDKELAEARKEVRELLEGLSASDIDRLLGMPLLLEEVLEHAEHSPQLAKKLMQLADAEYETLSPEEKEKGRRFVAQLLEAEKTNQVRGEAVECQPQPQTVDKPVTRQATSHERERRRGPKN
jgi:hypothetical protein